MTDTKIPFDQLYEFFVSKCKVIEKQDAEIERLRGGIQAFLDGDYEPKVKKIDKCPHGVYGYDACEACIEQHFVRVLNPTGA
jgi:hypothetical protein